jgi:hypothetical protein
MVIKLCLAELDLCSPDCWLEISIHPEVPATGRLDTGFLGFPLSLSKC